MKNRGRLTLLFSTLLVLPGFAQQPQPNSGAQPASQGGNTICNEPLRPPASRDYWNGDEPNVVNLFGHGLTTKGYVQGQLGPVQNCLDELSNVAASHTSAIKDVDAHTQHGIQLASVKTKEADEHATQAGNLATAAKQSASQPANQIPSVERIVENSGTYKAGTETQIYFDPGQSVLSRKAKSALDQLAASLKDQRGYIIEVRGYSAGHGRGAISHSQKIADSVERYLVKSHSIPVHHIYTLGMGDAQAAGGTAAKRTRGGRVDISVLKNDLVSSAQR